MDCPTCGAGTRISDSRKEGTSVVRRRRCTGCGTRFSTKEAVTRISRPASTMTVEQEVAAIIDEKKRKVDARRAIEDRHDLANLYGDHFG